MSDHDTFLNCAIIEALKFITIKMGGGRPKCQAVSHLAANVATIVFFNGFLQNSVFLRSVRGNNVKTGINNSDYRRKFGSAAHVFCLYFGPFGIKRQRFFLVSIFFY